MARTPRPVAEVPFLPQEDRARKISPVAFHPEGAPQVAPDFTAEPDTSPEALARVAAVEEGLQLQADLAGE